MFKLIFIYQTIKRVLIELRLQKTVRKDYMIWLVSNSLVMFHYNVLAAVNNIVVAS